MHFFLNNGLLQVGDGYTSEGVHMLNADFFKQIHRALQPQVHFCLLSFMMAVALLPPRDGNWKLGLHHTSTLYRQGSFTIITDNNWYGSFLARLLAANCGDLFESKPCPTTWQVWDTATCPEVPAPLS